LSADKFIKFKLEVISSPVFESVNIKLHKKIVGL